MNVFFDSQSQISNYGWLKQTADEGKNEIVERKDQLKINRGYINLQILDTTSGLVGDNGQLFLIGTGTLRLCVYINGALKTINLT